MLKSLMCLVFTLCTRITSHLCSSFRTHFSVFCWLAWLRLRLHEKMCQMAWPIIKSLECSKFWDLHQVFSVSLTVFFMCMLVKSNYSWFSKIQCFLTNDREGKQLIYMGRFIFSEMPQGNLSKRLERNSAKRKQQEDPVFLCNSAVPVANTNIITFQSSIFHILKLHTEIPSRKSISYQTQLCLLVAEFSTSWHIS